VNSHEDHEEVEEDEKDLDFRHELEQPWTSSQDLLGRGLELTLSAKRENDRDRDHGVVEVRPKHNKRRTKGALTWPGGCSSM